MRTKQYSIVGMHCEGTLTMEVDETIFDEALFVETLGEEGFGINR